MLGFVMTDINGTSRAIGQGGELLVIAASRMRSAIFSSYSLSFSTTALASSPAI